MSTKTLGMVLFCAFQAGIADAGSALNHTIGATADPEMLAPAPDAILTNSTETFLWTAGTGASSYWLYVGTTVGGRDLFDQGQGANLNATVSGLPSDGRTLYVRLWWVRASRWEAADFRYTAARSGGGTGSVARFTTPTPGATLTGSTQNFQWTGVTGVSRYWLYVGSTAGGRDLFDRDVGTNVAAAVSGLPTDGRTLHVRLWSLQGSTWAASDVQYTAANAGAGGGGSGGTTPQFTAPVPNATLTGSVQNFQWNAATGVSRYWLYVGSAPGGQDVFSHDVGANQSVTVSGLPTDGRTLHVRLWWLNSGWQSADFTYIAATSAARVWVVAPGGTGNGSGTSPFGRIQDAMAAAQPGDQVAIRSGTYNESVSTVRSGAANARITLQAIDGRGTALVTASGRVLTVGHPYITVDGLAIDGQYGIDDAVRISDSGDHFILKNTEVRRSSRDLVDMGAPQGVLIEGCLIHHSLNATDGRTDAHGIVAGAVLDLTIRDTEIHTFSGDGFQVDPGRAAPGWNRVTVERTRIWLAPLPSAENGFPAGSVTGEHGIALKASTALPRSTLVLRDITASGFRGGLPNNMAAFNLKENVDVTVNGVTVYDSFIAFRLRGGVGGDASVAVTNAVVYNVTTAFRYEDNIQNLRIWNSTVGNGVTRAFEAAVSTSAGLDVRNLLVLGGLPAEASHSSNRSVGASAFVNAAVHNYQLAAGSPAIDAGVTLSAVTVDRAGVTRPQGSSYDVGAYERR